MTSFSKIKSLAKDSLIYGLSGIISRMIMVVLVPVYTRIFNPDDFAIINLINTTYLVISLFTGCALDNSAARWFYDTHDIEDRKRTIASWFWFQLGVTAVFTVLLILLTPLASNYLLKIPLENTWIIWIIPAVNLLLNILPVMIWNWYRMNRKPVATVIFTLSQSLLTISLTILFVVILKWGIKGVYLALFFSGIIFSFIALMQMNGWLNVKYFTKSRLKEMLRFSMPLIPAAVAFWVLNTTNSYFILFFRDKTEVGLFAIGAAVASMASLFTGAFQQAWGPFAFSILHEEDHKKVYADVFRIFALISSVVVIFLFMFSPEILIIFTTEKYYGASWVASILSLNVILIAFSYIASVGTGIAKNSKPYSAAVIIACAANVLLNFALIPFFGKEGSALATVLSQCIVPVIVFYFAQKFYPIPYHFTEVIVIMLIAITIGTLIRFIPFDRIAISILVKSVVGFLFIGVLYFIYGHKLILPFIQRKK